MFAPNFNVLTVFMKHKTIPLLHQMSQWTQSAQTLLRKSGCPSPRGFVLLILYTWKNVGKLYFHDFSWF